jgi:hypothetical protein
LIDHSPQSTSRRTTLRPRPIPSAYHTHRASSIAKSPGRRRTAAANRRPTRSAPPVLHAGAPYRRCNGVEEAGALSSRRQLRGKPPSPIPHLDLSLPLSVRVWSLPHTSVAALAAQVPGDVVLDLSEMNNQTIKLGAGLRQVSPFMVECGSRCLL